MSGVSSQNQFQHSVMPSQNKNATLYNRQISQPIQPTHHHNQLMHPQQPQQPAMHHNQLPNQQMQQQKEEQIYAPVAHLQQKMINQQQQNHHQPVISLTPCPRLMSAKLLDIKANYRPESE